MYKEKYGNIPNKDKIHYYLIESNKNQGPWVRRSKLIGKSARDIAKKINLDEDIAYAVGSLFEIGKKEEEKGLRQIMIGFHLLRNESYFFPAQIAISHAFVIKDIKSYIGEDRLEERDRKILENKLITYTYTEYDKLIQVLDNSIIDKYIGIEEKQKYLKEKYKKIPYEEKRIKILKEYEKHFEEKLGRTIKSFIDMNEESL